MLYTFRWISPVSLSQIPCQDRMVTIHRFLNCLQKTVHEIFSPVNTILKRPKDGSDCFRFCDPTWRRSNGLQSLYSLESTICRDHLSCVRRLLRLYCILRIILFYEIVVEHFQSTFLHVRVEYSFLSYCYE